MLFYSYITYKDPGVGMFGAGITNQLFEAFKKIIKALEEIII